MEAVQWGQKPHGTGFRKAGCEDAEECSCDGRGMSRRLNAGSWSQQRETMKLQERELLAECGP